MKVLIVEDDYYTGKLYNTIFDKVQVDLVIDGNEFIMKYNNTYDLLIIDLQLPNKSGYEVLNFLNSINDKTLTYVISASLIDRSILDDPKQKFRYLRKPFDIKELKRLTNIQ